MTVLAPRSDALPIAVAALAAAAFVAVAWLFPGFDVAYGGEGMHIALDGIEATVFVVVGVLAWSRYLRDGHVFDLALALASGILSADRVVLRALPTLLDHEVIRPYSGWASSIAGAAAATTCLAGAVGGDRVVERRGLVAGAVGALALVPVSVASVILLHARLPQVLDPAISPVGLGRRPFLGDVRVLALQGIAGAMLLTSAWLLRPRRVPSQALLGWMAPALAVGGVSTLSYVLFLSPFSYWVFAGDILWLVVCVLLTAGIVAELRAAGRRAVELAVLEERRRLARDLHDGVAQELAFIAAELHDLPPDTTSSLRWVRSAAERALFESRRAIEALTLPVDRPLAVALAAAVEDVTARTGVALRLELDEAVHTSAPAREAMLRVVREATMNAIRHGRAGMVRVTLAQPNGTVCVVVSDDGVGFDHTSESPGFGLTSMRERVAASGGSLGLRAGVDGGTAVEARWPALSE